MNPLEYERWYKRADDPLTIVTQHLTTRDRTVVSLLFEHRVMTTEQLAKLAFPNDDRARHRLLVLYRIGVLDRFKPLAAHGRGPYHYVLGPVGIEMAAAEHGEDPKTLRRNRHNAQLLIRSKQLEHLLGVNGFFADLAAVKGTDRLELIDWWSERRCTAHWGRDVRPDGYAMTEVNGVEAPFFLEYDRGTESIDRVVKKLDAYRSFGFGVVLFWFENPTRERNFVNRKGSTSIPHATSNAKLGPPRGSVWRSGFERTDRRFPIEKCLLMRNVKTEPLTRDVEGAGA